MLLRYMYQKQGYMYLFAHNVPLNWYINVFMIHGHKRGGWRGVLRTAVNVRGTSTFAPVRKCECRESKDGTVKRLCYACELGNLRLAHNSPVKRSPSPFARGIRAVVSPVITSHNGDVTQTAGVPKTETVGSTHSVVGTESKRVPRRNIPSGLGVLAGNVVTASFRSIRPIVAENGNTVNTMGCVQQTPIARVLVTPKPSA